ncbi:MAG: hypothetical protein ACRDZS_10180, partial [Acidimicrobiales bacterium]
LSILGRQSSGSVGIQDPHLQGQSAPTKVRLIRSQSERAPITSTVSVSGNAQRRRVAAVAHDDVDVHNADELIAESTLDLDSQVQERVR